MVRSGDPPRSHAERRALGRELRTRAPRSAHSQWTPPADRPDPIELLEESNRDRLPGLVPVRYGRMLVSPFAFLRGAAVVMANDLAATPDTGAHVQACGDAHLANFGVFATPERNLIFDVNDFDETLPAPWEWDVKRLAVSVVVAARNLEIDNRRSRDIARQCVAAYRTKLAELSNLGPLDIWYQRVDVEQILTIARERKSKDLQRALRVAKARQRTSLTALPKLTKVVAGRRRIVDDPPLIVHERNEAGGAEKMLVQYAESLPADRRPLLDHYEIVDTVRKVVGIGSVGTRCYLTLMMDSDNRAPLFLQLKEATEPVAAPHVGEPRYENEGERVVVGQRLLQAASDIFLGWTTDGARDYYVRQFRDMKGSVNLDVMTDRGFAEYSAICGRTLARAHARSCDPTIVSGYLGNGTQFDRAVGDFAEAYADQTERDHAALEAAAKAGRVRAMRNC